MTLYPSVLICILAIFLSGGSPVAGSASTTPKARLIITGTGSSIGVMQRMGEVFQKKRPPVTVSVLPSIGSTGGIKAVKAGKVDIGFTSRPLTPNERNSDIIEEPYGRTAFVFGVQASNPINGLALTEIEEIYARKRTSWSDGTPIRLILRPTNDDFSVYLESISARLKSASKRARSIPGVYIGMTDQEATAQIEKTPGSFGTTSTSLIAAEKRKIKALSVDGTAPTLANISISPDISAVRYPYVMTLSLVCRRDKYQGAVKEFIDFVFSAEGRKILSENGHVAIPRMSGK